MRGRHLGPSRVLLVDLPWAGAEHFVKTNALRGLPDRAGRVTTLSVGGQPGDRCNEPLGGTLAQEYWASAPEGPEEVDEDEPPEPAPPEPEAGPTPTPSRPLPLEGLASQRHSASRAGALFGAGRGITDAQVERLRALAGPAPRTGQVERQTAQGTGLLGSELYAKAELGALPPPDVQDPGEEVQAHSSTLQALLLAQMRQNAVLLERLAVGTKTGDGVQDVLAAGGGNASDSSGGIKGHLAREAFIKQVSDLTAVASRVQSNALQELGRTQAESTSRKGSPCRISGCCRLLQR